MTAVESTAPPAAGRTAIKLVFLLQALASGSFFTRIPDLQAGLGIDAATLGLAMIGMPVGAIATFLVASRIVERVGTRALLVAAIPLMALAVWSMALVPVWPALAVAVAAYTAMFALTNVAMNVEADRIEAATGRRLMNTCHGVWSVGQLVAFLAGAWARGADVPVAVHFGVVLPIVLAGAVAVLVPMRAAPARSHVGPGRPVSLPSLATLKLVGFMIGGSLVESATRTWSVIYARDTFAAPEWAEGLTLPAFVAAMAGGRFFADAWSHRHGPAMVGRALLGVALAGLLLVIVAPALPFALVGFALMGLGVCTSFPASTSAAARLGDRPSSENVAALTLSANVVMLGAPPLMGLVAEAFGIRATFGMVVPFVVLAIVIAGVLEPRR